MMKYTNRRQTLVEDTCWVAIDDDHPVPVDAVGGRAHRGFEVSSQPGDEGLLLGAPCRQGADPHGHQRVAAVLEVEKPRHEAAMRVVRETNASALAGEGVGHD
jgi:hypothetical protein